MRVWWRRSLCVLGAMVLIMLGVVAWLVRGFDGESVKRVAIDWMQAQHARQLVFDGPLELRLWPQPTLTVQGLRLSQPGQPLQPFASVEHASLTLRLEPLLVRREIVIERIVAKGVQLKLARDRAGRRNVDDFLARAGSGGQPEPRTPLLIDSLELTDAQLQLDDAMSGAKGRFVVQRFTLGAFGPGLLSPLHLQARAELQQPPLQAAVVLDTGVQLLPAKQAAALPVMRLDKPALQLRGQGFDLEDLDARLQAEAAEFADGSSPGLLDGIADLRGVSLQFSGKRFGGTIDSGKIGLARLHLDTAQRSIELDDLAVQLSGHWQATRVDAQLNWPTLKVAGDQLKGGPIAGRLVLAGDRRLQLQLRSAAPSGMFERIIVPAMRVELDDQFGSSALRGHAEATWVLEPRPRAVALESLSLVVGMDDPVLPPLQLVLNGQARFTRHAGVGSVVGTINEQRVEARVAAAIDRPRPFVDLDARFAMLDLHRFAAPAQRNAAPAPEDDATPVNLQGLRWADLHLQLKAARLLRPPNRIDALDMQARIDDGVLEVRRLAGRAWGGRFEASGSADAGNGRLALRLLASDVDLRGLLSDTLGYDGLRGRGRFDADLRSHGSTVAAVRASLNGRATLALQPAASRGIDVAQTLRGWRTVPQGSSSTVAADGARQTDFSQLDASFDIVQGVGRSTDLDGRSDFLRVSGEESIDLVQGRIDYLLRTRVVNTANGRAGAETVMLNSVTVPVELQGPFGDLQWQVRWPSVTAAVAVLAVPNVARGAVGVAGGVAGGVVRGARGVLRGAAGVVRAGPVDAAATSPPSPAPAR